MKKRIVTIALVVALLATCFAGTYAYLTDFEQATNEFTIGNVGIDLYETVNHTDKLGNVVTEGATNLGKGTDAATEYEYKSIMPGDTMEKVVTVENTGDNDAYIALVIKQENYLNFNQNIDDYYEGKGYDAAAMQDVIDAIFPGWELNYAKDDSHIVRYMMNKEVSGSVLGYGYANHSYNADKGGDYYNYAGPYFTNGTYITENDVNNGNFMSITNLHDRVWIIYLKLAPEATYTVDLTTVCPEFIDNNSINAFEGMALDIKAFAIQAQGMEAAGAFAELFKQGFGF